MVTKDFNKLLEEVVVELKEAPEKVFHEKKEDYFIYNNIAYISYLLAKHSFIHEEILKELGLVNLSTNTVLNVLLTVNPTYYNEIATGLDILKYELENYPIYSIVGNDPITFIEEIDFYLNETLQSEKETYEAFLKHLEEQNKEFESLEEGVV